MTRHFLVAMLAILARALLAHGCGEVLRLFFQYLAPHMPPVVCVGMGLTLSVILVEIAATLWRRGTGSNEGL
jgi:xanthine/uracil permease